MSPVLHIPSTPSPQHTIAPVLQPSFILPISATECQPPYELRCLPPNATTLRPYAESCRYLTGIQYPTVGIQSVWALSPKTSKYARRRWRRSEIAVLAWAEGSPLVVRAGDCDSVSCRVAIVRLWDHHIAVEGSYGQRDLASGIGCGIMWPAHASRDYKVSMVQLMHAIPYVTI